MTAWPKKDTAYLHEAFAAGANVSEVAASLNRSYAATYNAARKAGLLKVSLRSWTSAEIDYLHAAKEAGTSATEIAEALNRTREAVYFALRKAGLRKFSRKTWSAGETTYLVNELTAGEDIRKIAESLGRSYNSAVCRANSMGITIGRHAPVPEKINGANVLAATVEGNCRVLIECTDCGKERWYRLANLKYNKETTGKCRTCIYKSWSPAPPRLSPGDVVGHYTVLAVGGQRQGGFRYFMRDNRCGHERYAVDKPAQPFLGRQSICGCPVRSVHRDGYVIWYWYLNGKRVSVLEHRIVMEQSLGREMYDDENVHHKNGLTGDNRPENLELWTTSQPCGQRVEDKIIWAVELLRRYELLGGLR